MLYLIKAFTQNNGIYFTFAVTHMWPQTLEANHQMDQKKEEKMSYLTLKLAVFFFLAKETDFSHFPTFVWMQHHSSVPPPLLKPLTLPLADRKRGDLSPESMVASGSLVTAGIATIALLVPSALPALVFIGCLRREVKKKKKTKLPDRVVLLCSVCDCAHININPSPIDAEIIKLKQIQPCDQWHHWLPHYITAP